MSQIEGRRPIGAREAPWARACARALARSALTPNQISIASIAFAVLAGWAFWQAPGAAGVERTLWFALALFGCQGRLLCNLFDGMVAIEGGKASKDGPFWNEFPDRAADIAIFLGAGFGVGAALGYGVELGWAASLFAVLTAYVRELGRASGAGADYAGPMAKQHRMATISIAAIVSLVEPYWGWSGQTLAIALALIAIGAALTSGRRAMRLIAQLKR